MLKNKILKNLGKYVGLFAMAVAVIEANVACPYLSYQPKLPDSVKKLRRL